MGISRDLLLTLILVISIASYSFCFWWVAKHDKGGLF